MLKQLIRLANHLDKKGFYKESDYLDLIIKRATVPDNEEDEDTEDMDSEESAGQKVYVLIEASGGSEEVIGVFDDMNPAEGAKDMLYDSQGTFSKLEIHEFIMNDYPYYPPNIKFLHIRSNVC